jgi:hypothetical protein
MESWISPEDQNPGLRCPRRKDRNSFEANWVWTAFPVQIQIKICFKSASYSSSRLCRRIWLFGLEIGYSGDFPFFFPALIAPEKPMVECHLQLQ